MGGQHLAPHGDVWSINSNEAESIRESSTYKIDAHTMRVPKNFNISIHPYMINEINDINNIYMMKYLKYNIINEI
jgi:hypothetical protein